MSMRSRERVRRHLSTEGRTAMREEPIVELMVYSIWGFTRGFGGAVVTGLPLFERSTLSVGAIVLFENTIFVATRAIRLVEGGWGWIISFLFCSGLLLGGGGRTKIIVNIISLDFVSWLPGFVCVPGRFCGVSGSGAVLKGCAVASCVQ